jgi:hypothetical protein
MDLGERGGLYTVRCTVRGTRSDFSVAPATRQLAVNQGRWAVTLAT